MCLLIYQQIDFYESVKALDFTFIYLEQVAPRAFFIASIMNALAVIFSIYTNCHFKNSHYFSLDQTLYNHHFVVYFPSSSLQKK